ncbi:MAG TPA: outer membrane lipoprotein carrier protein LolA, partial [Longimicrobiales bacterium]|nr:outer membrane lipoprotein carrier protein LolA [Longimicrobiales bacterium]
MISAPFARPALGAAALVVGLSGLTAPAAAQEGDPWAVLEKAAERYAAVGTFCADFHQTLDVPLLGQTREGTGRLCQKPPDLFSMRFTDPPGDLVVVDGKNAWVYTPSRDPDQVLKAPASAAGERLDFHREFLDSPRTR